MKWCSKETYTPFDRKPIPGLLFIDGDLVSRAGLTDWTIGMKASAIAFPSGLFCEIESCSMPIIYLCGGLQIPFYSTRDEAYTAILDQNDDGGCSVFRVGETDLELWHYDTETVWLVAYDSNNWTVADITVTQA
ncbi:MAG: hypothetical protein K8L97_20400 [Anaerolineae bacterium]|nr:hypothetical protein [Anaerolineae bacterium]